MKKQWVQLFCGVSASGKSTHAKGLKELLPNLVEINRDEWRFKLFTEGVHDWSKYKFTKERENAVTDKCNELFDLAVQQLKPIVISNTNLNKKDQDHWKKKAEEAGYDFEIKYFDVTLTEALKRDKKRGALSVGQDILFDQWQRWLEISKFRKYEPNEFKPKAVILDIDGTIAVTTKRKNFDYSKLILTDAPRLDVLSMVEAYASIHDAEIICVSGREDVCKDYTTQWLNNWCVDYTNLHMRKAGDHRCDTIVKEEIFWEHLAPHYNVIAAFDDRPRVIRKWKDLGIPLVVSVQKDYKEF